MDELMRMPEGGRDGYVYILREGLEHAAWLSVHGEGERQRLAAEFVNYILQRAGGGRGGLRKSQRDHRGGEGKGFPNAGGLPEEGRGWGQGARGGGLRLGRRA